MLALMLVIVIELEIRNQRSDRVKASLTRLRGDDIRDSRIGSEVGRLTEYQLSSQHRKRSQSTSKQRQCYSGVRHRRGAMAPLIHDGVTRRRVSCAALPHLPSRT